MLMITKSIKDGDLLHLVGFFSHAGSPDVRRIAAFCGVSERTAQRWLKHGLPGRARCHFETLLNGDYLPDKWRYAGVKLAHDGVYLPSGHYITIDIIKRLDIVLQAVNWDMLPFIRVPASF
ncbi:hypothetical protein [Arsukibacterium sp.]|uniref:hypothetical protein n=1 Tax=Arsukibacterium sp. TaxID=1977258 RepID=UPI002FDA983A